MNNDHNTQENLKNLLDKIKDVKIAMMTTAEADGSLRSRPMKTQQSKPDGNLWFFTGYESGKTHEIENDFHVNLSYAEPSDNLYVSVTGRARVLRDQEKINELWTADMKAWFPDGKEDSNIGLIKVTIDKAEYWDTPNNTLVTLYGMAKAAVTGEPAKGGENKKINL
ncbi:pyridoxamine 5'-phosphate oxidase family protein [Pontibacter akesuensis]|uniref:General stress protein 26 n=1 Tax=Pontibacter akesuensis TaxID=388950 RepID=A0A1I7G597_9BACT|nr:pyridoxamine 5'-phosphate oxidase family protein [Pontibacter akesuensis]GHA58805.1 general stress protein [Pontibacter akesuensis]SFU43531.1 General stress protein 26 [Pontibacter akesuensis]